MSKHRQFLVLTVIIWKFRTRFFLQKNYEFDKVDLWLVHLAWCVFDSVFLEGLKFEMINYDILLCIFIEHVFLLGVHVWWGYPVEIVSFLLLRAVDNSSWNAFFIWFLGQHRTLLFFVLPHWLALSNLFPLMVSRFLCDLFCIMLPNVNV